MLDNLFGVSTLYIHRWARYFKKVAERALNAKKNFKALALYKAFKAIAALKKKKNAKALQNVKTIAFEKLAWRIIRVTPTSAPAWDRTGAALARSKRLNHYPVVAAYFWHVR